MDASGSSGGLTRRQEQGEEIDFDALKLVKTNHDVYVRVSDKVELDGLPGECNLMAISNTWGMLAVGGNNDVRIHRLDELHRLLEESPKDSSPTSAHLTVLSTPGRPVFIRFAVNDEKLLVTTINPSTIQMYQLKDLVSGNTNPCQSVTTGLPERFLDIIPNPAAPTTSDSLARIIAMVTQEGLIMLDAESGRIAESVKSPLTCASWSPKGKQIVCGDRSGKLVQYTPEGTAKAEILPPPELQEGFYPTSVEWIENDIFLVAYKNGDADDDEPLSVFTIHRNKAASEMVYHEFYDPINTMGLPTRSGSHRFVATLKQWGESTRRLAMIISGRSSEVGIMRLTGASDTPTPVWETLMLDETARGVMPAGKSGESEDTSCIGLDLDLTSRKPIVMGIIGGVEIPNLAPAPRLLAYSQEGFIISFNLQYPDAGEYPHMVRPQDIGSSTTSSPETTMKETSTPAKPMPPPDAKPAFGGFGSQAGAFGSASTSTAFGAKPASPSPSGFGQSAFGKPSGPGSGQSAFAQPSTPAAPTKSAFGQSTTAFGSSAFGSSTTPAPPSSSTPAFGKPASSTGFGQSAFGSSPTPSAFGQPAVGFGQKTSTPTPGFGQSAFGTGSTSSGASAFGAKPSTPTTSSASGSAFGQTAFGQKPSSSDKPAFGQSSAPAAFGQSAFGQPSKPTGSAFGQSATASSSSPFSSTPAPASTGGFAGFGQKPAGQTGFGFGGSAFGQKTPSESSGSGSSPFGSGGAVKSGSAFGSSSGFGQSAFGSKPATPHTPSTPAVEKPAAKPSSTSGGGFGLDSLGPALDTTKASQAGSSKGSASSPIGQSSQTTPPDSPVFGASRSLSAQDDEDDSPPPTPKAAPATLAKPTPATTTSSFIKPATAFGSASSFGTFVPPATPAPAPTSTTPSSTPNAFSKPVPTTTTTPAGAFGSPAFGASAFGKSSTPSSGSGFGKTTAPPAVGNITGGFGGFAAKKTDSPSGSAFTGFGASAGTGKFAFGSASGGSSFSALLSGDKEKPKEVAKPPVSVTEPPKAAEKTNEQSITPPPTTPASTQNASVPPKSDAIPSQEASTTTPPSPPPAVKEEVKTPEPEVEPKGYNVPEPAPATTPSTNTPIPAQKTTTPSPEPTSNTQQPDTSGSLEEEEEVEVDQKPNIERQAGSSPEIIEHADADNDGHDDDGNHDDYDEDDEQYDEEGGEEGSYEGEGEYDGEEYDEDDYEEEDEGEGEEEEEEEEDGEEERSTSPRSEEGSTSPPSQPQPQSQVAPSLFSRLAPPPPPSGNAFTNKHAVRTSSPLSSHPPQYADAETSTPPGTPPTAPAAKSTKDASNAAPPPFFGFKSDTATTTASKTATTASTATTTTSTPTTTQDHGPPSLFGKPPPGSGSSLGLGQPPSAPSQPEQKAPFSFGLGKPSGAPATSPSEPPKTSLFGHTAPASSGASITAPAPKSPFSFGSSATPPASSPTVTPSATSQPTSLFGRSTPQAPQAPQPVVSTPIKPNQPTTSFTPAADPGKFATPARTPVKDSPQAKDDGSRQMAAVMSRMITDLMSEIKTMREALDSHAEYHHGLEPQFNKLSIEDLDSHSDLPFSSLSDIAAVIDQLAAEMTGIALRDHNVEHRVLEVQSRMIKTDMKVKQAEKLIEAHDDVNLAYHTGNQGLGIAQTDERASLRRRKQAAESKLDDLERSVQRLKKAADEGRPTVDKLHQSIKEVGSAIDDKKDLIEELNMRVKSIRLSTPGGRRSLGPASNSRQSISINARPKATVFQIPSEITEDVERQLDQQEHKPAFKIKVARSTRVGKTSSTISVGKLGMPGKIDISAFIRDDDKKEVLVKKEKEEEDVDSRSSITPHAQDQRPKPGSSSSSSLPPNIKSDPSFSGDTTPTEPPFPPSFSLTPAPTSGAGSPSPAPPPAPVSAPKGFGGMKFTLDPGDLSSAHTRSRTAVSGAGSRAHHAAPRLGASPAASPSASSPPAISFFAPPQSKSDTSGNPNSANTNTGGNGKAGPKGFVSFSGFGQK